MISDLFLRNMNLGFFVLNVILVAIIPTPSIVTYVALGFHAGLSFYYNGKLNNNEK